MFHTAKKKQKKLPDKTRQTEQRHCSSSKVWVSLNVIIVQYNKIKSAALQVISHNVCQVGAFPSLKQSILFQRTLSIYLSLYNPCINCNLKVLRSKDTLSFLYLIFKNSTALFSLLCFLDGGSGWRLRPFICSAGLSIMQEGVRHPQLTIRQWIHTLCR